MPFLLLCLLPAVLGLGTLSIPGSDANMKTPDSQPVHNHYKLHNMPESYFQDLQVEFT